MIKPTVGRVVWYWLARGTPQTKPLAAIVCHVASDSVVNLTVFDVEGNQRGAVDVPLIQEGDERPMSHHCEWMPYQKAVASGKIEPVLHEIAK
jgi:hypothetical protein